MNRDRLAEARRVVDALGNVIGWTTATDVVEAIDDLPELRAALVDYLAAIPEGECSS